MLQLHATPILLFSHLHAVHTQGIKQSIFLGGGKCHALILALVPAATWGKKALCVVVFVSNAKLLWSATVRHIHGKPCNQSIYPSKHFHYLITALAHTHTCGRRLFVFALLPSPPSVNLSGIRVCGPTNPSSVTPQLKFETGSKSAKATLSTWEEPSESPPGSLKCSPCSLQTKCSTWWWRKTEYIQILQTFFKHNHKKCLARPLRSE